MTMAQQVSISYVPAEEDFKLWRFLDHTRYVIARLRELELAQYGLTPEQAYVLDILNANGGSTTMGQIADMTLRPHHTISTLIERMAKHGLLEKRRTPQDRRSYEIVVTAKGDELFRKVKRKSIEMAFSTLSKEDKRLLSSILKRLLSRSYELSGKQFDFTDEYIPCL